MSDDDLDELARARERREQAGLPTISTSVEPEGLAMSFDFGEDPPRKKPMPIVDTAWRCVSCHAEFPTAGEAEDCEKRDEWGLKLEDHAARMYEVLREVADHNDGARDLLAELGPPPPPRKD